MPDAFRPLYTTTAKPQVNAPPLAGETRADVAIVGGGLTGLSSALHLAEAGLSATLLEARAIGNGCSGRNGGQVNPGLKLLPDAVEARWGKDLGGRMVALAHRAPGVVFDLIDKHGIDCAPARTGTIRAAVDAAGVAELRELVRQSAARGGAVRLLDGAQMRAATGSDFYRAGALDPRGGHLNPLAYTRGLALAAQRAGARLHGESPALAVARQGGLWRVRTAQGAVLAPELVIATNGYTGDLWPGLKRVIAPVYTYIAATDPLPEALRRAVMPAGSALYEADWEGGYYRLDEAGRLLIGGRGPQRDARSAADYRHLARHAEARWPALKGLDWPFSWHGQVAVTADHFPHLIAPEPGVHLMLGYNGRGVAMATVAGAAIATRIASGGRARIDLPVRPRITPMPLQRFWRAGAEIATAAFLLRDRLRGR